MDLLWYGIPLAIMATVFYFKLRSKVRFKQELPLIAQSLGLRFSDTVDELPQRVASNPDLPEPLSNPETLQKIQSLTRNISKWKIEGEYNGVRVRIRPYSVGHSGQSPSVYTRVEAFSEHPFPAGLLISNMGNTAPGKPEIKIETLDKKIIVRADNEPKALQLLNDSDVQRAITSAFEFSRQVIIEEDHAQVDKFGTPMETDYYRNALDVLTRIVRAFENRARFQP